MPRFNCTRCGKEIWREAGMMPVCNDRAACDTRRNWNANLKGVEDQMRQEREKLREERRRAK